MLPRNQRIAVGPILNNKIQEANMGIQFECI